MCRFQTVQAKPANINSLEKFQKNFKIVCPKKGSKKIQKVPKNGHFTGKPKTNPCLISDSYPQSVTSCESNFRCCLTTDDATPRADITTNDTISYMVHN